MSGPDLSRLKIERTARARPAGPRRRTASVAAAAAVLAAGALAYHVWLKPAVEVEAAGVVSAYPSRNYTLLNATGYAVAQRKAAVASKATGRLEWIGVREGSQVKKGEIIARLESQDVAAARDQAAANVKVARSNVVQAQAEYDDAQRSLKRSEELLAKQFVSPSAHDSALARFEKARAALTGAEAAVAVALANLRAAQTGVEYTLIRAPFDGVVLVKHANLGDLVSPFNPSPESKGAVVTMADMSTLEVEADVAESNLSQVHLGQPCEIQLDALPEARFRGQVQRIVPTVDRAKATVLVKVGFVDRDPRVLPEMSARVAFLSQEVPEAERTARTAVNPAALATRDGRRVAFVIREGKAVQTPVQTGARLGDLVEVTSGLKPGDSVVLRPAEGLRDGAAVSVARQ